MKSNNVQLDKLTKRPIQYWFEDGIGELVTGGLFFLIGINFCIQAAITSPQIKAIISLTSVIIIGGGVILARKLISRIKEQIIYPRTGYVSYPKRPSKGKVAITIGSTVTVAIFVIFLGSTTSTFDWTPIVISAICGGLMFYQAVQTGVYRLYIESALAVLIGIIIAFLEIGDMFSSGIFFIIFGLVLMIGGGCALHSYFKKAPPITNKEF